MKKFLFVLALLVLTVTLFACGGQNETTEPEYTLIPVMVNTESDYKMIYPLLFDGDNFKGDAIRDLEALVKENAGGAIVLKSDYLASDATPAAHEILLGPTNRPESAKAAEGLRYLDYVIGFVDGKLCVVGGSDEATAIAIRRFATMFFSKTQNDLVLRDTFFERYNGDYALDSLTFFGKDATDAAIVYDNTTKADAEFLREGILKLSGYKLPLVKASEAKSAYTITLLSTDADISANDTTFTLSHSDAMTRSERVNGILAALKANGKVESATVKAPTGNTSVTLLDLNVYSTGTGTNSVVSRYPRLMKLLAGKNYPDVLTLQDVSPTWIEQFDISGEGYQSMNEVYGYVGKGRNDDDDSVKNPIFYKKDTLTLIDSGTIWLSETPDFVSVGWDGRQRSVCTWAILENKTTKTRFAVMSAMLDSYGIKAKTNGAALLVKKAAEFDCPVLVCGDMQGAANLNYVKAISEYQLFDTQKFALSGDNKTAPTVNGAFGTDQRPNSKSDFIFASYGDFTVKTHIVDETKPDGGFVSNHWALYAEFTVKEYK